MSSHIITDSMPVYDKYGRRGCEVTGPLYAEASGLNFPPGQWPLVLTYQGEHYTRGKAEVRDGELMAVQYLGPNMRVFTVRK